MASRQGAYSALRQDLAVAVLTWKKLPLAKEKKQQSAKIPQETEESEFQTFLHFIIDVLNILADVSCSFQKDNLLSVGSWMLETKCTSAVKRQVFAEYTASEETSPTEMRKADICDFVYKVVAFVETRFQFLKQTPFSNFQVFVYRDHPNTNEEEFASYSNANIVNLCQHFEGILGRDATDTIGQWPELTTLLSRKRRRCSFETYTSLMAETPEG